MFSNKIITIGDSLFISVFSIIAVFFILLIISYMIDATVKALSLRKKPVQSDKPAVRAYGTANDVGSGVDPVVVAIVASAIDSFEKDKKHRIVSIKQ